MNIYDWLISYFYNIAVLAANSPSMKNSYQEKQPFAVRRLKKEH